MNEWRDMLAWLQCNLELSVAVSAISSVVIAVMSMIVALVALASQRKHNRLSVRPLAYITVGDYENQIYVKIKNNGTGPMIFRSLEVVGALDSSKPLIAAMPQLEPGVFWTHFTADILGRSVPPGGEYTLIDLRGEPGIPGYEISKRNVRSALSKLALKLMYTDVYDTNLPATERSLRWFERTLSPAEGAGDV